MRGFKMTREQYLPKNATKVLVDDIDEADAVGFVAPNLPGARYPATYLVFAGKAAKPVCHFAARTLDEAYARVAAKVREIAASVKARAEMKAKWKAEREAGIKACDLKPGDILSRSWGYEQTNVDFYQISRRISATMVEVVKIAASLKPDEGIGPMSGKVVAVPLDQTAIDALPAEKRKRCKITGKDTIGVGKGDNATKWDGRPLYCSWYG